MGSRLAVDFGTSHTVAVVQRRDEPPRALLFDGSPILPSAVCLGDDSVLYVGGDAQRMALVTPTRYEPHPKRRIGDGTVLLGDTDAPVVDLIAGVLRRVAEEARQAGLTDLATADCTVLTCPSDWGAARRAVLTQAARQAGLGEEVRLVDEPEAAATYCVAVQQEQVGVGQPLMVFDFGGGTLDVALVRRERDAWRVLAAGGLDDLGGVDVDAALVGHLGQLLELRDADVWRRIADPTTPAELRDRHAFWSEVRSAKEMLSRVTTAPVQVPRSDDTLHLTREELERVAGPLVARAVDETRRVLQRAGVEPRLLAGIFLVGGSSRLPLVATRLHTRFAIAPSVPEQPELPVAYGALLATAAVEPVVAPEPPSKTGAWPAPADTGVLTAPPPPPAPVSPAPPAATAEPAPEPSGWQPPDSGVPVSEPSVSESPASEPPDPEPSDSEPSDSEPADSPVSPAPEPSPLEPPLEPPVARPPAPRRVLLAAATIAVTVLVMSGCYAVLNDFGTGSGESPSTRPPGKSVAAPSGSSVPTTGKLTTVKKVPAPTGTSAVAAVAGPGAGYYAMSGANKTRVTAQPTDGGQPWTVDLAMYPKGLKLFLVGDLLVIDGGGSVNHGGEDARAVIDTKTRRKLWEKTWGEGWDVAYYGTDVVVKRSAQLKGTLSRIDLRTGGMKWHQSGPAVVSDDHGQAALSWPTDKKPAAPLVVLPDDSGPTRADGLRPHLHSGAEIVEICGCGVVAVINADTGKPRLRRTGLARLNTNYWTVYEGLLVGVVDQNGQDVLVAYRLTDLGESWRHPAPPGSEIREVAPCGPKLLCVARQGTGAGMLAIDTTTGKDAWPLRLEGVASAAFVPTANDLLVGEESSGYLREAHLVDFTGKVKKAHDDSLYLMARYGKRAVFADPNSKGWGVFVSTIDGGKRSPDVIVSDDEGLPDTVSLAGDTVVFTVWNGKDDGETAVYVLKASGLPAP